MTDEEWARERLARSALGDQRALEALYARTAGLWYALCLRLLKRQDLAEEVPQGAFLRIWSRAATFDPARGKALTWMLSIVRHRALDVMRTAAYRADQSSESIVEGRLPGATPGPCRSRGTSAMRGGRASICSA